MFTHPEHNVEQLLYGDRTKW